MCATMDLLPIDTIEILDLVLAELTRSPQNKIETLAK